MKFEAVERYRRKIRQIDFVPLSDEILQKNRKRFLGMKHINAIEGVYGTPLIDAFFDMIFEERVPSEVSDPVFHEFLMNEIISSGGGCF